MIDPRLLSLVGPRRGTVAAIALVGLAATATHAGQALLAAVALVRIVDGTGWTVVAAALAGAAAMQVARTGLLAARERFAADLAGDVCTRLRARIHDRLLTDSPYATAGRRTGDVLSVAVDGVESVRGYVSGFLPQLISATLSTALLTVVLVAVDPFVAAVLTASAVLILLAPLFARRLTGPAMATWSRDYRRLYADSLDLLQGMVTLKSLNADRRRTDELAATSRTFAVSSTRVVAATSAFEIVVAFASAAGTAGALWLAAARALDGALSPISLVVVLLLAREYLRPFTELGRRFHSAYAALATIEKIMELGGAPTVGDRPAPPTTHELGGDHRAGARPGPSGEAGPAPRLEFVDVVARYPGSSEPALDGASLQVPAGSTVALVGPSGAGKSTLVNVLLGLLPLESGRILIDDRETDLAAARARAAVVSQDVYLFHATIAQNLRLADPTASDSAVADALREAGLDDVVAALPAGADTVIGERGESLSGGQRQRLALARALLRRADLLVLDEATSNLDGITERAVLDALDAQTRPRTTLVIAHRRSTLRVADLIAVVSGGQVEAAGPPAELLPESGGLAPAPRADRAVAPR
ncbi:ABC transporter ATP-binding protein/permease [Parafrankia sp. FMc2]|uniref:ABC transporter ATP-binding protein/permease n=1 Tax=Parafrankia sp. FMc2 TaxID=3233196 RepID=UPI0034D493FD